jgi:hypothetical protein
LGQIEASRVIVRNSNLFATYDLLNVLFTLFIGIWVSIKRVAVGAVFSLLVISRIDKVSFGLFVTV